MMIRCCSLLLLWSMLSLRVALAQFTDNFADGDYTQNPTWTPDNAANWTIDNGRLRSNNTTANASFYITTPSAQATPAQWEFTVNLLFATSGTNYVDVYLSADQTNLMAANLNGYFVRVGNTADEISLYRRVNGTETRIIDGADGIVGSSSNNLFRIKVTRTATNLWTLQRDASGIGNNYQTEGTVTDNSLATGSFFGILVRQSTASFFQRHFFSNFYVGEIIVDNTPPTVLSVEPIAANKLRVVFSENVQTASAENTANYTVNGDIGNPSTAAQDLINRSWVVLTFASNFVSQQPYTIQVNGVNDLAGNPNALQSLNFTYIQTEIPQYNELIITEIMADPRGAAQPLNPLPDAEYVEIFNRSTNKVFRLSDCRFRDATNSRNLPDILLFPQEYALLVDATQAANFAGKVIPIASFPSLTNSGELLTLETTSGQLLHTIEYSDNWYGNNSKKDGGWSLEMIDPNNPCAEADNWTASVATRGGTPAAANSVSRANPDSTPPQLLRAVASGSSNLILVFNEKINEPSAINAQYSLSPSVSIQAVAVIDKPNFKRVQLTLSSPLQTRTAYQVRVEGLRDCAGNLIAASANTASFGLAEQADSGDVILNEILFNPRVGGSDFLELYNQSDKFINLNGWRLANLANGIIANQTVLADEDVVMAPRSYLALTPNVGNVQSNYPASADKPYYQLKSMPRYNDDAGTVFIINNLSRLMERFDYTDKYHSPLIDRVEGISLERIAFGLPTNDRNSWQSASTLLGATPGYANSQQRREAGAGGIVRITPQVITPDQDGQSDFASIDLEFEQGGQIVEIRIFDKYGREIRQIAAGQRLGTSRASFVWDGTDARGEKAPVGYYLVWVQAWIDGGAKRVWKERVVVGARF